MAALGPTWCVPPSLCRCFAAVRPADVHDSDPSGFSKNFPFLFRHNKNMFGPEEPVGATMRNHLQWRILDVILQFDSPHIRFGTLAPKSFEHSSI